MPLAEIREADATAETADLYERIRVESGSRLVNYVWRHLATIPGAAAWCWDVARANEAALRTAEVERLRDEASGRIAQEMPADLPALTADVGRILATYNRNNAANMARMGVLLTALEQEPQELVLGASPASVPARDETLPPLPDREALSDADRRAGERLGEAGPAAKSSVDPSLWRHLTVQDGLVPAIAQELAPALRSGAFRTSWAALRDASRPNTPLVVPAPAEGIDRARAAAGVRTFSERIAELTLAGAIVANWAASGSDQSFKDGSQ